MTVVKIRVVVRNAQAAIQALRLLAEEEESALRKLGLGAVQP
jgi:hypothetical protein